jgi:hypothetical protein
MRVSISLRGNDGRAVRNTARISKAKKLENPYIKLGTSALEDLELVGATEEAMNSYNPRNIIFYIFRNENSFSGIPLAEGTLEHTAVVGFPVMQM